MRKVTMSNGNENGKILAKSFLGHKAIIFAQVRWIHHKIELIMKVLFRFMVIVDVHSVRNV